MHTSYVWKHLEKSTLEHCDFFQMASPHKILVRLDFIFLPLLSWGLCRWMIFLFSLSPIPQTTKNPTKKPNNTTLLPPPSPSQNQSNKTNQQTTITPQTKIKDPTMQNQTKPNHNNPKPLSVLNSCFWKGHCSLNNIHFSYNRWACPSYLSVGEEEHFDRTILKSPFGKTVPHL